MVSNCCTGRGQTTSSGMLQAEHNNTTTKRNRQQHQRKKSTCFHLCRKRAGRSKVFFALLLSCAIGAGAVQGTAGGHSHRSYRNNSSNRHAREIEAPPGSPSFGERLRNIGERLQGNGGKQTVIVSGGNGNGMVAAVEAAPGGNTGRGAAAKSTGYNSFFAGGLAGSISTTVTCPIEVSAGCL